jgi:nucleolar protein 14
MHSYFQALRQKQREEADDTRHQLDQELDTIRGLLSGPDSLSESVEKMLSSETVGATGEDRDQQYDQIVRELVFDQRSKPKDRTKTEEELALEAKIALEKAERRRIRRMNGEDDAESSEDGRPRKRRRSIGGDDLEDDFNDADDWNGLGGGLKSSVGGASEEGSFVDDSSDEDSGATEYGERDEDPEPPWPGFADANDSSESSDQERGTRYGPTDSRELPYTFPCPSSHGEFLDIVKGIADWDIPTVVERIRALHHPSLSAENPSRLQVCIEFIFLAIVPRALHKAIGRRWQVFLLTIFSCSHLLQIHDYLLCPACSCTFVRSPKHTLGRPRNTLSESCY